jgi:tRNA(Ile)-lysidine synthase
MPSPPALPDNFPRRLQALPPRCAHLCLRIARFVEKDLGVPLSGRRILVGFSGGADSTALLLILSYLAPRLRLTVRAAHLDHGLRPSASREGEACAVLCAALGIPCSVRRTNIQSLSRQQKTGLEETARRARYAFYAHMLQDEDDLLALGHQNNDLAEDILMRLIRGAGWPALGGMPGKDGRRKLIRPLLLTPRAELETFLTDLGVTWVEDATNLHSAHFRNRVRFTLLPFVLRENPAFLRTTATLWRLARLDEDFFQSLLEIPPTRFRLPANPASVSSPEATDEKPTEDCLCTPARVLSSLHQALRLRLYRKILEELAPGHAPPAGLFALDTAWRENRGKNFQDLALGRTARIRQKSIFWGKRADQEKPGRKPRSMPKDAQREKKAAKEEN